MRHILFVCTGNTCRSAMAEYICNFLCCEKGYECTASSAGLAASCEKACENAICALRELYGIDLSSHISKPVSRELVEKADIIFAMTERHTFYLCSLFPEAKDKIITADPEIPDPFLQDISIYKSCARELFSRISTLLPKVCFKIRDMCLQDIQTLAELENKCFSAPWSAEAFRDELKNENARFLVCVSGDETAGYVGALFVCDEASITDIAVFPKFRGMGIATALLRSLFKKAHEEGIKKIFLEVRKSNTLAQKLYKKSGFFQCNERKNFYSSPTEDALIFTKDIG